MKKLKYVISRSNIDPRLIRGVVKQLGGMGRAVEQMADIANHGIDGGFSGFIYHVETCAFFRKYRKEISALVSDTAEEFGLSEIDFVSSFRCLESDHITKRSIARCLYASKLTFDNSENDDTHVANALAWFAGEEVARAFNDE